MFSRYYDKLFCSCICTFYSSEA